MAKMGFEWDPSYSHMNISEAARALKVLRLPAYVQRHYVGVFKDVCTLNFPSIEPLRPVFYISLYL